MKGASGLCFCKYKRFKHTHHQFNNKPSMSVYCQSPPATVGIYSYINARIQQVHFKHIKRYQIQHTSTCIYISIYIYACVYVCTNICTNMFQDSLFLFQRTDSLSQWTSRHEKAVPPVSLSPPRLLNTNGRLHNISSNQSVISCDNVI